MRTFGSPTLLPEVLLLAYRNGYFPMADPDLDRILWHRPDPRGVIPLDRVRISRSLRKEITSQRFNVTVDTDFSAVIRACAERDETWINDEIIDAYEHLHELGYAHSLETWHQGQLVGGLYGVALGGAFFGESMFSAMSNASKVAFAHLVARLNNHGFRLLDTQYVNDFTASLGAIEIPDVVYHMLLADALQAPCTFV